MNTLLKLKRFVTLSPSIFKRFISKSTLVRKEHQCEECPIDKDACAEAKQRLEKARRKLPMRDKTLNCFGEEILQGRMSFCDPMCPDPCAKKPKVIIIGAGIAGLSAALRLINCGIDDIMILEATDRVGGRILTSWMGDSIIEMGPKMIHGGSITNSMFSLACMEGMYKTKPVHRVDEADINYLMKDGRIVTEHATQDMVFSQIVNELPDYLFRRSKIEEISLMHYLVLRTQQEILNFPEANRYDTERMFYGLFNSVKGKYGAELEHMCANNLAKMITIPGGEVRIPGGYITLLAPLVRDIPREYFYYNHIVHTIKWSTYDKPRVKVVCKNNEEYCADFVIVTLPLGVLKEKHDCMFIPELPRLKQEAIKALGVGYITRVYLEYISPWWAPGECNLRIAWDREELNTCTKWTKSIGTITEIPGSKHVITFTVGGQHAVDLELITAEELAIEFTNFIRNMMDDNTISYPNNVVVSKWCCSPFFRGSQTYMPIGSSIGHIKDMYDVDTEQCGSPNCPMPVLLAGEATHAWYFGTVHGARLSGIREANRVAKYAREKFLEHVAQDEFERQLCECKRQEELEQEECEQKKKETCG